jgi:hypothetical protein
LLTARLLPDAVGNARLPAVVRAQAFLGLSGQATKHLDLLLSLAQVENAILRAEALRALKDTPLNRDQRARLEMTGRRHARPASMLLYSRQVDWTKKIAADGDDRLAFVLNRI